MPNAEKSRQGLERRNTHSLEQDACLDPTPEDCQPAGNCHPDIVLPKRLFTSHTTRRPTGKKLKRLTRKDACEFRLSHTPGLPVLSMDPPFPFRIWPEIVPPPPPACSPDQ